MTNISTLPIVLVLACLICASTYGQDPPALTLDHCQELAQKNYPLAQQYDLIGKMASLNEENIQQQLRPNISLFGQATYQSDVTSLPIDIPGTEIPTVSKNQYKVYGEVSQSLTDSKMVHKRKEIEHARSEIDKKRVDVELYQVKDKVDELFFGTLMLDQRLALLELLQSDIDVGMTSLQTAIDNGIAISADRSQLQVEKIAVEQQMMEMVVKREATIEILEGFIHQPIESSTVFIVPDSISLPTEINRPEIALLDQESTHALTVMDLVDLQNKPRLSAFLQAGLGRPALNFLQNDFQPYFLGGLRFQWNLNGLFTRENDKELNLLRRQKIAVQKEVFLFNTNSQIKSEVKEMEKFSQLIRLDREIINLRNHLKETAKVQLENGIINANEYLSYVIAEDRARQNLAVHQLEQLRAQYSLKNKAGN